MIKEFKEFMMRGNVIDLAIAVIIGASFNAIVTGLVDGIIMPLIASIGGTPNVESMTFMLNGTPIKYGLFLQAVFNFLLIGTVLFFLVKSINKASSLVYVKGKEIKEELKENIGKVVENKLHENKVADSQVDEDKITKNNVDENENAKNSNVDENNLTQYERNLDKNSTHINQVDSGNVKTHTVEDYLKEIRDLLANK